MLERPVYHRISDDVVRPDDAVIVGIGWEPDLPPHLAPTADVMWPDAMLLGDRVRGASEGPFDVPVALMRVEEVRQLYGFRRILVSLADASYWRGEWGVLVGAEE